MVLREFPEEMALKEGVPGMRTKAGEMRIADGPLCVRNVMDASCAAARSPDRTRPFFLFCFEGRSPECELDKLFIGTVIIAYALVQLGDLRHLRIGERKVQDIQIVPDVIHVFAAGDHGEAHLGMPAEDDLGRGLAVLLA